MRQWQVWPRHRLFGRRQRAGGLANQVDGSWPGLEYKGIFWPGCCPFLERHALLQTAFDMEETSRLGLIINFDYDALCGSILVMRPLTTAVVLAYPVVQWCASVV